MALARAQSFLFRGQLAEARQALEEGLAVARAGVESEWVAWLLSLSPQIARTPEEFDASLAEAREAVRLAEECGNPASHVVALCAVGIAKVGLGHHSDAASVLQEALNEGRARQAGLFEEARMLVYLAQARLGLGDPDGAWATATEALDVARRQGARAVECLALLTRARLVRASGGPAEDVAVDLRAALTLAREIGATAYEAEIEAEVSDGHQAEPTPGAQ